MQPPDQSVILKGNGNTLRRLCIDSKQRSYSYLRTINNVEYLTAP